MMTCWSTVIPPMAYNRLDYKSTYCAKQQRSSILGQRITQHDLPVHRRFGNGLLRLYGGWPSSNCLLIFFVHYFTEPPIATSCCFYAHIAGICPKIPSSFAVKEARKLITH